MLLNVKVDKNNLTLKKIQQLRKETILHLLTNFTETSKIFSFNFK